MKNIKALLAELGFQPTTNPYAALKVICFPPGRLAETKEMGQEVFVKDRLAGNPILANVFMVMVGLTETQVFVQACQTVGSEALAKDKRLTDGGMVWFSEVFTDEDGATAFIRKANESYDGPLYGPSFPAPEEAEVK